MIRSIVWRMLTFGLLATDTSAQQNQRTRRDRFLARFTTLSVVALLLGWSEPAVSAVNSSLILSAMQLDSSQVTLEWQSVTGRNYEIQATSDVSTSWTPLGSIELPSIATIPTMGITLAAAATAKFFQLTENPSPYDPDWEKTSPSNVIQFTHDAGKNSEANGASLKMAIQALNPGDRLEIGTGTYSINSFMSINLQGTAEAPIWIVAAPEASVVITRPDANQNIINVGSSSPTRYLCIRGIEFIGGSHGVRLHDCANVWIDRCKIHETADVALSANSANTSRLHITRNEIWNTNGTGEGMYLGGNNGSVIMSKSIIALNHVHDTDNGVLQGDGIEVKQGSWGNLIAANIVHDCNYPCILVYGTAGQPPNIVENNVCYRSNDSVIQIQGECIVRNNLVMADNGNAFASQPHQGEPTEMTVVHNTFISAGNAARVSSWSAGSEMVFANNACYSQSGAAFNAAGGTAGVTIVGNISHGTVTSGVSGFQVGAGLNDFRGLNWDTTRRDARPSASSALFGTATETYATTVDLDFLPRTAPHTTGCYGQ